MRVKIIERGWTGYNGDLGTVPFENGVSVRDMPTYEAYALGAYIRVMEIDEDGNELGPVSPSFDLVKIQDVSAEIMPKRLTLAQVRAKEEAQRKADAEEAGETYEEPKAKKTWTKGELEIIGSEKGIAGLREIGEPMGAKHTSIRGLIAEILVRNPKAQ